jgi:hypothetical protein
VVIPHDELWFIRRRKENYDGLIPFLNLAMRSRSVVAPAFSLCDNTRLTVIRKPKEEHPCEGGHEFGRGDHW